MDIEPPLGNGGLCDEQSEGVTSGNKCYKCPVCKKIFIREYYYKRHIILHGGVENGEAVSQKGKAAPYKCSSCDEGFESEKGLQLHLLKHPAHLSISKIKPLRRRKVVNCADCTQVFYRRVDLQLHRRMDHKPKNGFMCTVCRKNFSCRKRLKIHAQFHNVGGEFLCFYCEKQFNKGWKMKIHMLNHTGKPPYICAHCGDDFLYPGKVMHHLKQVHNMWFACKDCGIGFDLYQELTEHVCKLYQCKDCDQSFISRDELALHVRNHDDVVVKDEPLANDVQLSDATVKAETPGIESSTMKKKETKGTDDVDIDVGKTTAKRKNLSQDARSIEIVFIKEESDDDEMTSVGMQDNQNGHPSSPVSPSGRRPSESIDIINEIKNEFKTEVQDTSLVNGSQKTCEQNATPNDRCQVPESRKSHSSSDFKVPEAVCNNRRNSENSVKMPCQKQQRKINPSKDRQKGHTQTIKLYAEADAKLAQKRKASFESWLTEDAKTESAHDFVFGFEASVKVSDNPRENRYFAKSIPSKAKVDMSFEDLCQF